jgi:hypothetical protein
MSRPWAAGPWRVGTARINYAEIYCAGERGGGLVALAIKHRDARLIAAAPELYEALHKFVEHFGDPFKNARAALAKADGKKIDEPHS